MTMPNIVDLTKQVEKRVCRGRDRYYLYFGCTPFAGGMSRGMTCGCNFRCAMCLSPFREFLHGETRFILPSMYKEIRKTAGFYSPEEVVEQCVTNEKEKKIDEIAMFDGVVPKRSKLKYLDVGYAEIAIGKKHLLGLCEASSKTDYVFVVETNGWLIGYDQDYASELARYRDNILVRVGVKAGSPEWNARIIGVKGVDDYVFKGIYNLLCAGITPIVAMMCDERIYPKSEVELIERKIRETGYKAEITREKAFPYYPAYKRWVERGNDPYVLATDGKIQINGKRIPGTFFLERFDGSALLLPDEKKKGAMVQKRFLRMLNDFTPEADPDFKGVIEFDIDGKGGGSWHFIIDKGTCRLERGMCNKVSLRYTMNVETAYECYITEKTDFARALFEGDITLDGNMNLLYKVARFFNLHHCNED